MGIIGHQPGVVRFRQCGHLRQRCQVPIHGKHAICDHESIGTLCPVRGQEAAKIGHVVVPEDDHAGARHAGAGNDAGVAQLVSENNVAFAKEAGNDADVGQVARPEDECCFRALDAGKAGFKLGEKRIVAGDKARGAGACAIGFKRFSGGRFHLRVLGEVEIIIAAEGDDVAPIARGTPCHAAARIHQLTALAACFQLGKLAGGKFVEAGHAGISLPSRCAVFSALRPA